MRKILFIILIFLGTSFALNARAGIIIRPVINAGLISYWSFNEGTGTKVGDMSGNGNTGTWNGTGSHWTTGKFGGGGSFNGTNDYVESSNFADNLPQLSVSVWFKSSQTAGTNYPAIVSKLDPGSTSSGDGWALFMRPHAGTMGKLFVIIQASDGNIWRSKYTTTTYNDGKWHHAVMLVNNLTVDLYVDGARPTLTDYQSGTITTYSTSYPVRVGRDSDTADVFNGIIDEVRIYNRALDASEITKLYESGLSRIGINQLGLVPDDLPANATVSYVREDCTGYSPCYNSLYDWEANYGGIDFANHSCSNGDLTCLNMTAVAKIDGPWNSPDTKAVDIDGWTTDANNYIHIYTTASARHPGKWDETKYRLVYTATTDYENVLRIEEGWVRIDGLQIKGIWSNNHKYGYVLLLNPPDATTVYVSNNIVTAEIGGNGYDIGGIRAAYYASAGTRAVKGWNNIVYGINWDSEPAIYVCHNGWSSCYWYNNTVVNNNRGMTTDSNTILKNNLAYNNVDNYYYYSNYNAASTNNLSGPGSDADIPPTNARNGVRVNFVDEANKDFHLSPADSGARNYGADLSNDANLSFSTDIDRQARKGSWDIGADEARGIIANAPQTNQLTDGLVGYWTFDGKDIDGNEAKDKSGNNNTGTISGAIKTIGKVGQALSFDGVDDYVSITNSASLRGMSAITISAWIYYKQGGESYPRIVDSSSSSNYAAFITLSNNALGIKITTTGTGGGTSDLYSNEFGLTATPNAWQHVVWVWDSKTEKVNIYKNGVAGTPQTRDGDYINNDSSNPFMIGERPAGDRAFNGFIDEVRVYNRALKPEEIKRLYNLGR